MQHLMATNLVVGEVLECEMHPDSDHLHVCKVNVGNEESKSGFEVSEILPLLEHIGEYPNIFVRGLMTIPPISKKEGDNRKFFQEIFQLSVDISDKKYDNVLVECLSMGMSDDFEDAIACGSTMIRIGTAIFGARDYTKLHQK